MHHQRSTRSLRQLRLGAYHFLLNVVMGIVALCLVGYSTYLDNQQWLYISLGILAFWLLSLFVFLIKSPALKCSLCMTPLWVDRKCQRHKKVKRTLGISYRLGIALAVVFKGKYRCPYCGEPFSARKVRGAERRGK